MDVVLLHRARQANKQSLGRLRNHPFVYLAHTQKLSEEQTHRWIMAASWDSRAFRELLEQLVSKLEGQQEYALIHDILKKNSDDENGNGNPKDAHWRHYIDLAQQLGYTESDLLSYQGRSGVQYAVQLAQSVPSWSIGAAVGYMLINEGATPITYHAEAVALRVYHPKLETDFFRMHVEVDEHHVAELYEAVRLLPDSAVDEVLEGISLGERGMAVILDEALGMFEYQAA